MKKFFIVLSIAAVAAVFATSCKKDETAKSFNLTVNITLPEGVEEVNDIVAEATKGNNTTALTVTKAEKAISATASLPQGEYKIAVNGSISSAKKAVGAAEVSLYADQEVTVALALVSASPIIVKAFQYTPGKQYYIQGGDSWIEIVNNSDEDQYLDQIILVGGMGGQKQANAWQANGFENLYGGTSQSPVFAFPGTGKDHVIKPGESVVIANNPKNHKDGGEDYKNCADLSHADWEFYCSYNASDVDYEGFDNLDLVFYSNKYQANWGQGFFSNAVAIIKLPEGVTPAEYAAKEENLMTTPATTSSTQYLVFPSEYVLDAVDIWDPTEEVHYPTFLPIDDAQGVIGPEAWSGQGVRRKVAKIENGRAYYQDTNNSSKDFVAGTVVPGAEPTSVDAE